MGLKRTDEFRQDAVRIALISGLTRKQVAYDLSVGMSTLNKWITAYRDTDMVSKEDLGLAEENDRFRREVRILKEERDILKSNAVLRASKAVRFRFIEEHRDAFPAAHLCKVMDVSMRGLRAFRSPPKDCIHHTDSGSQYCSHDYQKILRQHGFKVSMNGKGNCYDNAAVETFFKTIKAELIWRHSWETRRKAEMAIFEYIN